MKKAIGILLTMVMILSLSLPAFAASGDVTVDGHIGTSGNPSTDPGGDPSAPGSYDITYSTTVHWWVTQDNPTTVVDGDSSGPNSSVVNKIQNNNTATEIKVSLNSFELMPGDATDTTMQDYLTLNLKGDLAADGVGSIDLSVGYTGPTTYTALLEGGAANAWTYGFGGIYGAPTLTTSYAPQYTMNLGFAFA